MNPSKPTLQPSLVDVASCLCEEVELLLLFVVPLHAFAGMHPANSRNVELGRQKPSCATSEPVEQSPPDIHAKHVPLTSSLKRFPAQMHASDEVEPVVGAFEFSGHNEHAEEPRVDLNERISQMSHVVADGCGSPNPGGHVQNKPVGSGTPFLILHVQLLALTDAGGLAKFGGHALQNCTAVAFEVSK
jgi:hypothetical protein